MDKVADGSALVDQAGATMGEIVASVQRVTDIMAEISAASQEQSAGIEQVNQTITQMDETTQQNAALVEEATAAARRWKNRRRHWPRPSPPSGWTAMAVSRGWCTNASPASPPAPRRGAFRTASVLDPLKKPVPGPI